MPRTEKLCGVCVYSFQTGRELSGMTEVEFLEGCGKGNTGFYGDICSTGNFKKKSARTPYPVNNDDDHLE